MKTYMFPGQGSQAKGMGGDLFDEFSDLTAKADKILGYSIKELCLEDPNKELGLTQFTQPALYVVNALSYFKKVQETGEKPDFVAGHSLGEFNALLAADVYDFEAGLKLVKKRGELMSEASEGAMAAIINSNEDEIRQILKDNNLNNIDLANFNSPSQIVISGLKDEIKAAQSCFQQGKILYYPLNTSGAFHSRFMKPSQEKFATYLKKFKLAEPQIPVIANVTAREYKNDEIAHNMASQIAGAVRWSESVQYLNEKGNMEFVEIGHGNVLAKMVDKILKETAKAAAADKPAEAAAKPAAAADKPAAAPTGKVNAKAAEKVTNWNKKHPVGTKVKSLVMDYDNLETRSEAVVLFGHRAAVYMKDYNGYFDLDEISPV